VDSLFICYTNMQMTDGINRLHCTNGMQFLFVFGAVKSLGKFLLLYG
jgi:hypothetical protein